MVNRPGHVSNSVQCSILSSIQLVCFRNYYHVWSSSKNKSVICLNRIGFESISTCSTQNIGQHRAFHYSYHTMRATFSISVEQHVDPLKPKITDQSNFLQF